MVAVTIKTKLLEEAYNVDLQKFEDGKVHSLASLMNVLGLADGTPKLKSRGVTK